MAKRRTKASAPVTLSRAEQFSPATSLKIANLLHKESLTRKSIAELQNVLLFLNGATKGTWSSAWPTAQDITRLAHDVARPLQELSAALLALLEKDDSPTIVFSQGVRRQYEGLSVRKLRLSDLIGELDRLHAAVQKTPDAILAPIKAGADKKYGDWARLVEVLADVFERETGKRPTAYKNPEKDIIEGNFVAFGARASRLLAPDIESPASGSQDAALILKILARRRKKIAKTNKDKN